MSKIELSQIAKFIGGSGFPEKYQGHSIGKYPFIKVSDMNLSENKRYILTANNFVDEQLAKQLHLSIFPSGTTVFAKVGAAILLNRCRKLVKETIIDNNMMGAVPIDVDSDYLFYVLSNIDFSLLTQTGALPSINQKIIGRVSCFKCEKPCQRKIARILTTVDQVIEETGKAIEKLKNIKQGMMHDLFTRGIDVKTGKLRPTHSEALELYKETELGWIPKEWGIFEIKDSKVEIIDGDRGENYPKQDDFREQGFCLFLNAGNVTSRGFRFTNNLFITEQKDSLLGTGKLIRGDIVITSRGNIGNMAYYDNGIAYDHIRINSGMFILRNYDKDLLPEYLFYALRERLFAKGYSKLLSGSAQPQLPIRDFSTFFIMRPSMPEQTRTVSIAKSYDDRLHNEEVVFKKYMALKQGLMQDLLIGKVEVSPDPHLVMSRWTECKISDMGKVKGGKRLPAGSDFSQSITRFPYLRVTDMIDGTISDKNIVYVSDEIEEKIRNYKISKNDIYVTIAGTLGNFGTIPEKYDSAQLTENAAKITDLNFEKFDKNFLKFLFNSDYVQRQINQSIGVGGGVLKLTLFRIEKLSIKYPLISEQKKISRILTTVDDVIKKTEDIIDKLVMIKQGLKHDLFERGIDVKTGKIRPTYLEAPELYKETEIGWIPKEWDVTTILKSIYLKGRIGWQGLKAEEFINEGPYLVTGTDFQDSLIDWSKCYHISQRRFEEAPSIHLQNNDVLITKDGTIGKIALITDCPQKAILNSGIFVMRSKEDRIINKYFFYTLKSEIFSRFLCAYQGGSTINHLYQREFERFSFPAPQKQEQERIIKKMDSINAHLSNEKSKFQKYHCIKQGLMQDLLTGKVEVSPDPQDEEYQEVS